MVTATNVKASDAPARAGIILLTLIAGAVMQPLAVASFALMALLGGDVLLFSAVMAFDSFAMSFAGVALVAYMSGLTSLGYTATQYALLTSTYAWVGKILKGFSGATVEALAQSHGLMNAYALFFVGAGAVGLPALGLCLILVRRTRPAPDPQERPSHDPAAPDPHL